MTYPSQVTRYYCPLGTCDWSHDDQGPAASVIGMAFTDGLEAAQRAYFTGVEEVIRAHLETHSLEEWAREVTRLRDLVPAPVPDLTAAPWRQGRSHPSNLWAVTGDDWQEHQPIGRMDSEELAAAACVAHNDLLIRAELATRGLELDVADNLRWLLGAGHDVQVGHHDHDGGGAVYVRLLDTGTADLAAFWGCSSVTEGLTQAREWSEREGITP